LVHYTTFSSTRKALSWDNADARDNPFCSFHRRKQKNQNSRKLSPSDEKVSCMLRGRRPSTIFRRERPMLLASKNQNQNFDAGRLSSGQHQVNQGLLAWHKNSPIIMCGSPLGRPRADIVLARHKRGKRRDQSKRVGSCQNPPPRNKQKR